MRTKLSRTSRQRETDVLPFAFHGYVVSGNVGTPFRAASVQDEFAPYLRSQVLLHAPQPGESFGRHLLLRYSRYDHQKQAKSSDAEE
jgi:hypothetical protein